MVWGVVSRILWGTHAFNIQGAGAFSAPLVATQFSQFPHWSFHYLVSLAIALINSVLLISVFRLKNQDGLFLSWGARIQRSHGLKSAWLRSDNPQQSRTKVKTVI